MDLTERLLDAIGPTDPDARWAASGAMALTGRADGPALLVPPGVADGLHRLAARLGALTGALGRPVVIDGPALLGERAACTGAGRRGWVSVGGATRLLPAADDWLAVSLPRPSDVDLVPAWLGVEPPADVDQAWSVVAAVVAGRPAAGLVDDAVPLGLACAALGETHPGALAIAEPLGANAPSSGVADPVTSLRGVVVADLSSLWAGPLCGDLLARAGATVCKVESIQRPDGARRGNRAFFTLLDSGKSHATVDLSTAAGRAELMALLQAADVVIEGSRPRAMAQLGIEPAVVAAAGRLRVWCSITGYGRAEPHGRRVGFGDDTAVAGGLVAWDGDQPVFVADAAADPASGLTAATAIVDRLAAGGCWLVDVALARTAARLAAGPADVDRSADAARLAAGSADVSPSRAWAGPVAAPRARAPWRAS